MMIRIWFKTTIVWYRLFGHMRERTKALVEILFHARVNPCNLNGGVDAMHMNHFRQRATWSSVNAVETSLSRTLACFTALLDAMPEDSGSTCGSTQIGGAGEAPSRVRGLSVGARCKLNPSIRSGCFRRQNSPCMICYRDVLMRDLTSLPGTREVKRGNQTCDTHAYARAPWLS